MSLVAVSPFRYLAFRWAVWERVVGLWRGRSAREAGGGEEAAAEAEVAGLRHEIRQLRAEAARASLGVTFVETLSPDEVIREWNRAHGSGGG